MKEKKVVQEETVQEAQSVKPLVIRIDWGLGRNIAMTGAISEVAKHRPVKVIASRPLAFWGNPYIQSVHGLDDRDLFKILLTVSGVGLKAALAILDLDTNEIISAIISEEAIESTLFVLNSIFIPPDNCLLN